MSMSHMLILGLIALIVIPPEKLPEVARQIARFINELKRSADQILGDLKQEAMFKPDDIIDKNIREKLTELHNDLNQNLNFETKKTKVSETNNGIDHKPITDQARDNSLQTNLAQDVKKND